MKKVNLNVSLIFVKAGKWLRARPAGTLRSVPCTACLLTPQPGVFPKRLKIKSLSILINLKYYIFPFDRGRNYCLENINDFLSDKIKMSTLALCLWDCALIHSNELSLT